MRIWTIGHLKMRTKTNMLFHGEKKVRKWTKADKKRILCKSALKLVQPLQNERCFSVKSNVMFFRCAAYASSQNKNKRVKNVLRFTFYCQNFFIIGLDHLPDTLQLAKPGHFNKQCYFETDVSKAQLEAQSATFAIAEVALRFS